MGSCKIYVIIKAVCYAGAYGKLCLRVKPLYGLSQHMGAAVAQSAEIPLILL